ncbi:MAG: methyltransferase family protein [Candidatus Methylomirabilales bacterium]
MQSGRTPSRRWTVIIGLLVALAVVILLPVLAMQWDRQLGVVSLGSFRWLGLVPICLGALLGVWSCAIFVSRGDGTSAPWDPPRRFVIAGPYQYVRNPMMLGAFAVLFGEAVVAESLGILLYLCLAVAVTSWYVVAIEERGLEIRFGDTYRVYKERIPRWLPRLPRKGQSDAHA